MTTATRIGRRERSAQIRSGLLAAAERMLASKGFERTTIHDITSEADLGFGTFYRYFPSKDELYRELAVEGLSVLTEAIDRRCGLAESPRERLRAIVHEVVAFASERSDLFLLISASDAGVRQAVRRGVKDLVRCLRGWLEPGFADGSYRAIDPALAVHALLGMHTFVLRPWLYDRTMDERHLEEELVRLAEGALLKASERPENGEEERGD